MNTALEELLSPTGLALVDSLAGYSEDSALATSSKLRAAGHSPELVSAVLTQARLRAKAGAKFGPFAERMLFTAAGLEQATRLTTAVHHARRYLQAGVTKVADLTSGIGSDSMAFAALGLAVHATDIDEQTAAIAAHNLAPFPEAAVHHADGLATDFTAEGINGIYADPARRTGAGKRIFDPADYLPALDAVWNLRSQVPAVGIKVGPGIQHEALPADCEAQWVSSNGDVVEAGLWFGPLAARLGRSALLLAERDGNQDSREYVGHGPDTEAGALASPDQLGRFLFEPDGAVIRAGLVADCAVDYGARLTHPTIAYFTGDQASDGANHAIALAHGYVITDCLPYNVKALRSYLRARNIGRVTIKKRGISVTPEQLRPQLQLRGDQECTIVLTRIGNSKYAIIVQPLGTSSSSGGIAKPSKENA